MVIKNERGLVFKLALFSVNKGGLTVGGGAIKAQTQGEVFLKHQTAEARHRWKRTLEAGSW